MCGIKEFQLCFILTINLLFINFSNAVIPDYIQVCKRNDPEICNCILNTVENLRPRLRDGIPELNVPSMEPLPIKAVSLVRGPQSARVDLNITNLRVWGPSLFRVKALDCDINNNRFDFKVLLPRLHFKGQYSINMNILLLKVKGRGIITGNITNYFCDVKMQGHKVERNGSNYMQFEKLKIKLTVGHTSLRMDNLFNGDPTLGRLANDIVNQNSELFIEEIKPALEESMSDVFTEVANSVTNQFTSEELFPEN